ncbi:MAG: DUF6249 domain-containing protein [Acidobacteriota bacterium]|jgi:hypothetical protein|nr:DUF6249 domain-containing protein [Acidobacteriota bacterium]
MAPVAPEITPQTAALAIPIVAIVMGIGVAFWAVYWDYRVKQMKYRERELMIERGMVPPPLDAFGHPPKKPSTPEDYLRNGLILLSVGVGLGVSWLLVLHAFSERAALWLGIGAAIVGLLGVGNLALAYCAAVRKKRQAPPENQGDGEPGDE